MDSITLHSVNPMDEYVDLLNRKRELEKENPDIKQQAFGVLLNPIFDKFPDIQEISWTQQSEYWSDGDPTPFRSGHRNPNINTNEWITEGNPLKKAYEVVKAHLMQYSNGEVMDLFGNDSKVVITRDGVVTSEYYSE